MKQKIFLNCESLYLNWVIHTDNNLLYYDNRTLFKRFKERYINKDFCRGKTIIRGKLKKKLRFVSVHNLDNRIGRCNGFGKKIIIINNNCQNPDFN